jgi:hypothetical protein
VGEALLQVAVLAPVHVILLAAVLLAPAPALAQEAEGAAAGAKFLAEEKGLVAQSMPPEQWFATYAGPYWTSATTVSLTEKDDANDGLRRIEIEKSISRDEENPTREVASWWIDANGALVKGERRVFEDRSSEPRAVLRYRFKGRTVRVFTRTRSRAGTEAIETQEDADLPPSFVPDDLIVVLLLPPEKGKTWRFSTWGGSDYVSFTATDLGADKVRGRKGEVEARRVVVKGSDGETTTWLDPEKRVVLERWSAYPNVVALGGTESESHADWPERPADDFDRESDALVAGPAAPEKLAGTLAYGIYDRDGHARETFVASLTKDALDGAPCFHYSATTTAITTSATTVDDWWLSATGSPIRGTSTYAPRPDSTRTSSARVEASRFVLHQSDAAPDHPDASCPAAARFTPDALFLLRGLAKEEKGSFRFSGLDLPGETPFSIWLEVRGQETVQLRSTRVKAKHIAIFQGTAEANAWIDEAGTPLLVVWSDGDRYLAGSPEESRQDLKTRVGPVGTTHH